MALELVMPAEIHLPFYVAALRRSWSANTTRPEAAKEELAWIAADPAAFLASREDLEGAAPAIVLPDGTTRGRLPGFTRWMWDGEFCGSINFRWQRGTVALPPYVLGHVGYSVVPWKRRRGYATAALGLLLPELTPFGLPHVELTTDLDNVASHRVIEANGGVLVERFEQPAAQGGGPASRYRITLGDASDQAPMEW